MTYPPTDVCVCVRMCVGTPTWVVYVCGLSSLLVCKLPEAGPLPVSGLIALFTLLFIVPYVHANRACLLCFVPILWSGIV